MIFFDRLKSWIIDNYCFDVQPEVKDLVWLKKTVRHGEVVDWSFVDTVDYDLDSIPKKRELILDFKANVREVLEKCQLLSSES